MTRYILLFAVLFGLSNGSVAFEKPPVRLTGITSVDFLGSSEFLKIVPDSRTNRDFDEIIESGNNKKSPWIAGLLSLALPGAGEFYAENYVKAAIFFGIDVGSLVTALIYDGKGNKQTDIFESYAHQHYSPVRYAIWIKNNISQLTPNSSINPDDYKVGWDRIDPYSGPPYSDLNWAELNRMEEDIGKGSSGGFTHRLPYFGEQQYYELIGKYKQFSKGWDSQDPRTYPEEYIKNFKEGNSQFFSYGEMFNKADKYYTIAGAFISVMVANHILSALDAAWSAARYNNALHTEVSLKAQATPYGYTPLIKANITYSF